LATSQPFLVSGQPATEPVKRRRRGPWAWILFILFLVAAGFGIAGEILIKRANPILKGRVIETLSARFDAKVELDSLNVSLIKGLEVSGRGLRIFAPDDLVAAGATQPIIAVQQFSFHASLRGLFIKPTRVGTVYVSGLEIHIPPRQIRDAAGVSTHRHSGKMKIAVDHFLCEHSDLVIDNGNPAKEPKRFALDRIELWEIGPDAPWRYDATLVNAIPRGDIHATGNFGPWVNESPGDSTVNGHYSFDHADLNPIKGIGGMLSSVGDFQGQLNRIAVAGTTDTPDFSLDTANHPMHLQTTFKAIVDGTTGDTYLDPVNATLHNTPITCKGSVVNIHGQGHVIDLDVDIPNGHLEDLLALAVKTRPVYLTGGITTRAKLHIRPGPESVSQKLAVKGAFTLRSMHFTNPQVQDKVDDLSLRAQGRPAEAKPGAPDQSSQMTGNFNLDRGRIAFDKLDYTLPGAHVQLTGLYSLDGEQFDFHGTVKTEAKVSQMVSSWWKQLLLKPVDPFFHKDGAGAEVPIKISGTHNEPKFGLDFGRKDKKDDQPKPFHPTINHQY
jgi:hypothetical protein